VVLALGSYSSIVARKLGLKLPVYPIKGYSVTLPVDGFNGAPEIGGVDENNLVAWCKMGSRFRLTATAEFSGYDTAHKPSDFTGMLRAAQELFPHAADYGSPAWEYRMTGYNGGVMTPYIEDASFLKLRELSLSMQVPDRYLRGGLLGAKSLRLSLAGRNLLTWQRYSGLDPEVGNLGNAAIRNNLDVAAYPPSRSIFFEISAGF